MDFKALAYERLSAEDQQALDATRLIATMHEVVREQSLMGRCLLDTRLVLSEARKNLIRAKREGGVAHDDAKCVEIDAKCLLDQICDRTRTLRELRSSLQTLLRVEH